MSYVTDRFDDKIIELLKSGAAGFMPSDTIYGLSSRALDEAAVKKLHKIKGREGNKPFIVLIADLKMLELLSILDAKVELVNKYWPGPLSLVFRAPAAPAWLTLGGQTLAVRLPDDKALVGLINQTGPIISTSANKDGQRPMTSAKEAKAEFGEDLDFYVETGEINMLPSTIAKLENDKLVVTRQGGLKIDDTG